jgi:DNA-binding transcriptional ArsR family regulator
MRFHLIGATAGTVSFFKIVLEKVEKRVMEIFGVERDEIYSKGRRKIQVAARSLLCYWAVRELGLTATELAKHLGMTQPAVSYAVSRGEQIAKERNYNLISKVIYLWMSTNSYLLPYCLCNYGIYDPAHFLSWKLHEQMQILKRNGGNHAEPISPGAPRGLPGPGDCDNGLRQFFSGRQAHIPSGTTA